MELFSEMKNKYYLEIIRLINDIVSNGNDVIIENKKYKSTLAAMLENDYFVDERKNDNYYATIIGDYIIVENDKDPKDGLLKISRHDGKRIVYPYFDKKISIIPSRAELTWLKTALKDEKSKLFFTKEEHQKLSSFVEKLNNEDSFDRYTEVRREKFADDKEEQFFEFKEFENIETDASKLYILLKCIHENRFLEYSYNNKKRAKITGGKTIPYKIEYSVANDTLMLVHKPLFRSGVTRPIKSDLRDMYDLKPLEINSEKPNLKELIEVRKLKEPLVIRLLPNCKKEVLKRILADFAKYKRSVRKNKDDSFTISIECYTFQENDLVNEILSFGPQVIVESPIDIRKRIIEQISDPYKWVSE